jgi:quinolinate synthase
LTSAGELPAERTHILSTGAMLDRARRTTAGKVLVATEVGMLHPLRRVSPATDFQPVNPQASCRFMKMINAENLVTALRDGRDEVTVDPQVAGRARRAVQRMIEIGQPGGGE